MRHWKGTVVLVAVAFALASGCGRQTTGPSVDTYAKKRREAAEGKGPGQRSAPTQAAVSPDEDAARGFGASRSEYAYDPIGKRDPFRSFVLERVAEEKQSERAPLEQFDLSQLDVSGVIWNAQRLRALVQDPSGRTYIVAEGDPMGKNDGRIVRIDESAVFVREQYVDFHGEKTTKDIALRVRKSEGG